MRSEEEEAEKEEENEVGEIMYGHTSSGTPNGAKHTIAQHIVASQ